MSIIRRHNILLLHIKFATIQTREEHSYIDAAVPVQLYTGAVSAQESATLGSNGERGRAVRILYAFLHPSGVTAT